ncbi:MAG: hypothetical protein ACR2H1_11805 [Limisphaerales bacterium]
MLSAISSSPNQIYYLQTKTGIPKADKQTIKHWLDWGGTNVAYLKVRKDLPDWPAAGKVDGSAHIIGQRGLIFLFNPNKEAANGNFVLSTAAIGLEKGKRFVVSQSYPAAEKSLEANWEQTVKWEIPGQSVCILEIAPKKSGQKKLSEPVPRATPR